jgi:uncharacterized membrane protein
MTAPSWRARLMSWPPARLNLTVMASAYLIFGFSLLLQPHRWYATPAYHVLLEVFRAQAWGGLFLLSGTALGVAAWQLALRRWLVILSLVLAVALTGGWMLAFIARYLTSGSTTPETWVSWAVFGYLLAKVAISIDHSPPPLPPAGPEIEDFRRGVDNALADAAEDQRAVLMRALEAWSDKSRDTVSAACAAYGQALRAVVPAGAMPAGDLALTAISEARNALLRAEEAYERATGGAAQPVPSVPPVEPQPPAEPG